MLEELQSNKIQQDDEMFNLLRELQLKTATVNANNTVHNVNKEKTFYSSPIRPTHSHNASISDDIFFYSALGNETVFPITNFIRAERTLQHSTPSHLTNNINIYNNDDDDGAKSVSASTVNFAGSTNTITIIKEVKDETTDKMKEEKIKKLADLQKASAEMEFFYLTCIAVKMNLEEAYPDFTELTAESPIELYKVAQRESVPMNKFSIWIETRISEKYNLELASLPKKSKYQDLDFVVQVYILWSN